VPAPSHLISARDLTSTGYCSRNENRPQRCRRGHGQRGHDDSFVGRWHE